MRKKYNIIIYTVIILVISAILLVQYFAYKSVKADLEDRYNKELMLIAKQLANEISTFYKNIRTDLKIFNHLNEKKSLFTDSLYLQNIRQFYEVNSEKYDAIFIAVEGDKTITISNKDSVCSTNSIKEFAASKSGAFNPFFKVFIEKNKDCYFTVIGEPLHLRNGKEKIGYIAVAINLDYITENFVKNIKVGEKGYAWIIDQDGTLISNPRHKQMLYRSIFKTTETCFNCHESFDLEKRMVAGESGFGSYYVKTSTNNQIAYYPIQLEEARWSLAVIVPQTEIARLTSRLRILSIITFELIFGTVLLGGFMLFREKKDQIVFAEEAKMHLMMLKSKEVFEEILNDINELLIIIDTDMKVTFANAKAVLVLGDYHDKSCYELLYKKDHRCLECPINNVMLSGAPLTLEKEIVTQSGERRHYVFSITPRRDENGEITGVIEVGRET